MCTLTARFHRPNDSAFGQTLCTSSGRQTSTPRWRPLLWPSNRWKLFTASLCTFVLLIWTFPASTWAQTVPPHKSSRNTVYGKIQGYIREVLPGKFVEYYLRVPYAQPPLGDLRFTVRQKYACREIYIYIYMCVCVWMSLCVSVGARVGVTLLFV